jgi:hypothetical protein
MKSFFCRTLLILSVALIGLQPARAQSLELPSMLWVQDAAGGTLTGDDPEHMVLTLRNVRDHVTQFSDKPVRLTSLVSNSIFFFNWPMEFEKNPPNATLSYRLGSDPRPQNLVMTISNPQYDAKKKTVTYHASVMVPNPQILQTALEDIKPYFKKLPKSFKSASLFIDSAKIFPCSVEQMMNFERDIQTYVGVINSLKIGGTELPADITNLVNPLDVTSTSVLSVVGVLSDLSFDGGPMEPLNFGFLVSNANQVALTGLLDRGLSNTEVQISFTVYYYDPVYKGYYTAFWTKNTILSGLITNEGTDLGINVSSVRYLGVDQPLLFPVHLSVSPVPGSSQLIYSQQSNKSKSTINWGLSMSSPTNPVPFYSSGSKSFIPGS